MINKNRAIFAKYFKIECNYNLQNFVSNNDIEVTVEGCYIALYIS